MFKKWGFFNKYKQNNLVEYWKIILEKIKLLLSYFIKFGKNGKILFKKYPSNYTIAN